MKAIFEFIKLPLSLPINPIWDFLICAVIDELVYRIAFYLAGIHGDTANERKILHWLVRIPLFLIIWLLACLVIVAVRFVIRHWIIALLAASVIVVIIIFLRKAKK